MQRFVSGVGFIPSEPEVGFSPSLKGEMTLDSSAGSVMPALTASGSGTASLQGSGELALDQLGRTDSSSAVSGSSHLSNYSQYSGKSDLTVDFLGDNGFFDMPLNLQQAAERLGLSAGSLKRVCRKLGLARWPFRVRKSLKAVIEKTEQFMDDSEGNKSKEEVLEALKAQLDSVKSADVEAISSALGQGASGQGISESTRRYRQAIFKLNHRLAKRARAKDTGRLPKVSTAAAREMQAAAPQQLAELRSQREGTSFARSASAGAETQGSRLLPLQFGAAGQARVAAPAAGSAESIVTNLAVENEHALTHPSYPLVVRTPYRRTHSAELALRTARSLGRPTWHSMSTSARNLRDVGSGNWSNAASDERYAWPDDSRDVMASRQLEYLPRSSSACNPLQVQYDNPLWQEDPCEQRGMTSLRRELSCRPLYHNPYCQPAKNLHRQLSQQLPPAPGRAPLPIARNVNMPGLRPCEPLPLGPDVGPASDLPLEDASGFEEDLEALNDFLGMTETDLLGPL